MRVKAGLVFLLCAVLLTGCDGSPRRQKIAQPPWAVQTPSPYHAEFPSPLPEPTVTPTPEPTPTDTPEPAHTAARFPELSPVSAPMTPEEAAELYVRFLRNDITTYLNGKPFYHSRLYPDMNVEWAMELYCVQDLTGDGIPDLFVPGPGVTYMWSAQAGEIVWIGDKITYETIRPNGGVFYHRPGGAPIHDDYAYFWLSPESRELPEIGFSIYPSGVFYPYDHACYYIDGMEVTQEEWEERTAPYFALRDAEPTEEQKAQPFLDWAVDMGVDVFGLYTLEPWQEAYRDILLHPENYEDFYAVAEHIPSDYAHDIEWVIKDNDPYYFAVCDVNGDGVSELLLGIGMQYWAPQVLLNILRYNEETGLVEDIDGPRTYPLMDNLFFCDTGYFGTLNGIGGLYTEFWHLEEENPDHYWYGYERAYTADYDGPIGDSFWSTDGEGYTLQEYYDLLGDTGPALKWQEVKETTVLYALLTAR